MRILIAEDDSTNGFLLETFLSTYGDCTVVENGEEAVKAFRDANSKPREIRPDLGRSPE